MKRFLVLIIFLIPLASVNAADPETQTEKRPVNEQDIIDFRNSLIEQMNRLKAGEKEIRNDINTKLAETRQLRTDQDYLKRAKALVEKEMEAINEKLEALEKAKKAGQISPAEEQKTRTAYNEQLQEKRAEIKHFENNIRLYQQQINAKLYEVVIAQNQTALRLAQIQIQKAKLARSAAELSRLQKQIGVKIPKRTFRRGLK